MPYSYIERQRIHRRAKAKCGLLKRDAQDRYDFMQQCISSIVNESDTMDEGDAELICQMLWDEQGDLGEFD